MDRLGSLLSTEQIGPACQLAQRHSDHSLALIIAQMGGSEVSKALCLQQLSEWEQLKVRELVEDEVELLEMCLLGGCSDECRVLEKIRYFSRTDVVG